MSNLTPRTGSRLLGILTKYDQAVSAFEASVPAACSPTRKPFKLDTSGSEEEPPARPCAEPTPQEQWSVESCYVPVEESSRDDIWSTLNACSLDTLINLAYNTIDSNAGGSISLEVCVHTATFLSCSIIHWLCYRRSNSLLLAIQCPRYPGVWL